MFGKIVKFFLKKPWLLLIFIVTAIYYKFTIFGEIPIPADTLIGAYYPWLDYKWGYAVGVPVKNPLISDVFSQFYPWKQLAVNIFRSGSIPLWNKYSFAGTPFLATFHSSVLFPANLVLLIPKIGWGLFIFLSSLIASLSMYLFLGKTKYKANRIIGSLIFAFAGLMTTWGEYGTAVWAISFLPLSLYCVDQIIINKKRFYQPILSICIFFLCLAGHVQILTYTLIIIPIYIFFRLKQTNSKKIFKQFMLLITFIILGIALGSPQLLPSFVFEKESIRQSEYGIVNYNYGLTPWYESIRLFAADYFGNPATGNHFSNNSYHEQSSYLGVLSLPLIFALIFKKKPSKQTWFFILAFFTCLILIYDNPISHFILSQPLPLLNYSSISRLIFITTFLAGSLVVSYLENYDFQKDGKILQFFCFLEIIATLIGLLFINKQFVHISLKNSIPYIGILIVFIIINYLFRKNKKVFLFITLLIFSLDLGRYFLKYNPFVDQKLIFPNTPIIDYLQKQPGLFRIAREDTCLLPTNTWIAYGLESIEGYDPLFSESYARFFHVVNNKDYANGISRYVKLDNINANFLGALNVKYILTLRASKLIDQLLPAGFKLVYEAGTVQIYENSQVLNRAYFVNEVKVSQDSGDFIKTLQTKNFDPTKIALIEDNFVSPELNPNHGQIIRIIHLDNYISIDTSSSQTEFMVLADSYDAGWEASIDGNKTKIYRVNGSLRGIVLPPGNHHIIFQYLPRSFQTGIYIFISSALILVTYSLLIIKKKSLREI